MWRKTQNEARSFLRFQHTLDRSNRALFRPLRSSLKSQAKRITEFERYLKGVCFWICISLYSVFETRAPNTSTHFQFSLFQSTPANSKKKTLSKFWTWESFRSDIYRDLDSVLIYPIYIIGGQNTTKSLEHKFKSEYFQKRDFWVGPQGDGDAALAKRASER